MSSRAWVGCPVCQSVVTDAEKHAERHTNVDRRTAEAWTEACKAREEAAALLARIEALVPAVEEAAATAEEAMTTAEANRAEVAALRAQRPVDPGKPQGRA